MEGDNRAFLSAVSQIVAALDEVPVPAGLLDQRGVVRWQNRAALEVRGPRTTHHFATFIAPDDAAEAQAAFDAALEGGAPVETVMHALDRSEHYVGLLGRWTAIELRDGSKVVVVMDLGDAPAGGAPSDPGASGAQTLTRRQLDVLRLLDAGRSTAEIATELGLSRTTVRNHVANLLAALGAHSRLQAVAVARASGILSA